MRILNAAIAFLSLFLLFCFFSQYSHSKTWYVKQDGSGDAPTIQAAIDSSGVNDTVLVASGFYEQPGILVDYNKIGLNIFGESGDQLTILQCSNISQIILIEAWNVTIRGFTFANSPLGLKINLGSDIIVEQNTFVNNDSDGIAMINSAYVYCANNLIYSNHNDGIHVSDCGNYITIENNTIAFNNRFGMYLDDCGFYDVHNNIIAHNETGVYSWCPNIIFSCNDVVGNATNYELILLPDPTGSNGNMSYIIQFCDIYAQDSGNFFLQSDSPCAPGNNPYDPTCELIGRYPVGCGNTAIKIESWGNLKGRFKDKIN